MPSLCTHYHGVNAPVHARAKEFGLSGAGFSWRHRTMDWQEAAQHISRRYEASEDSVVLPVYMYDFWCLPYLLGQGLTKSQLLAFNRTAGAWLRDDLAGRAIDQRGYEARLAATLTGPTGTAGHETCAAQ
ncbi:MAG: hypothetical protein ABIX28_02910 [Vicinamibacterales bacterium]